MLGKIELTEPQAAWLAAAIDGEGSVTFFIKRDGSNLIIEPHISIYSNSTAFLNHAKKIIGWGNVYDKKSKPTSEYRLNSCNLCNQVLKQIFRYIIIKRFQARKMMQFCDRPAGKYTLKDLHIYEAIKRANWKSGPMLENELYMELKIQLEEGGE